MIKRVIFPIILVTVTFIIFVTFQNCAAPNSYKVTSEVGVAKNENNVFLSVEGATSNSQLRCDVGNDPDTFSFYFGQGTEQSRRCHYDGSLNDLFLSQVPFYYQECHCVSIPAAGWDALGCPSSDLCPSCMEVCHPVTRCPNWTDLPNSGTPADISFKLGPSIYDIGLSPQYVFAGTNNYSIDLPFVWVGYRPVIMKVTRRNLSIGQDCSAEFVSNNKYIITNSNFLSNFSEAKNYCDNFSNMILFRQSDVSHDIVANYVGNRFDNAYPYVPITEWTNEIYNRKTPKEIVNYLYENMLGRCPVPNSMEVFDVEKEIMPTHFKNYVHDVFMKITPERKLQLKNGLITLTHNCNTDLITPPPTPPPEVPALSPVNLRLDPQYFDWTNTNNKLVWSAPLSPPSAYSGLQIYYEVQVTGINNFALNFETTQTRITLPRMNLGRYDWKVRSKVFHNQQYRYSPWVSSTLTFNLSGDSNANNCIDLNTEVGTAYGPDGNTNFTFALCCSNSKPTRIFSESDWVVLPLPQYKCVSTNFCVPAGRLLPSGGVDQCCRGLSPDSSSICRVNTNPPPPPAPPRPKNIDYETGTIAMPPPETM